MQSIFSNFSLKIDDFSRFSHCRNTKIDIFSSHSTVPMFVCEKKWHNQRYSKERQMRLTSIGELQSSSLRGILDKSKLRNRWYWASTGRDSFLDSIISSFGNVIVVPFTQNITNAIQSKIKNAIDSLLADFDCESYRPWIFFNKICVGVNLISMVMIIL